MNTATLTPVQLEDRLARAIELRKMARKVGMRLVVRDMTADIIRYRDELAKRAA